jgi:hypothetical protein
MPAPAAVLQLKRILIALCLFGVSFGYIEAAVVVYLRPHYQPLRLRYTPGAGDDESFPLLRVEQLEEAGREPLRLLWTELGREAATLLLLAAFALGVAQNFRQWFAVFGAAFGLWDIFYYVFLKVLLDWPASLLTWDLLFLLPVPWAGPVLAPIIVAASLLACGVILLAREAAGLPVYLRWPHWVGMVMGGLIVIAAFCWDYSNLLAGGQPNPFNWPLFAVGEGIGLASFGHALAGRTGSGSVD